MIPSEVALPKRGWRTRGRLPHADFAGLTQAVTFRLADALPATVLARLQHDLSIEHPDPSDARRAALLRDRVHAWLDAGHGLGQLRDPDAMAIVAEEMRRQDGLSYRLEAFVIMPNHVHAVIVVGGASLGSIVGRWKGASARRIHAVHGGCGSLWNREYYDRFMRDDGHALAAVRYVADNPVRAGLVRWWGEWPGTWLAQRWHDAVPAG